MPKRSAGLLVYRKLDDQVEVLLEHPGGPFFTKKDAGVWTIPKGEYEETESALAAAKREFKEEIGVSLPKADLIDLGELKQPNGKIDHIWAIEADPDLSHWQSNSFELEWPPKSGKMQQFPEADKVEWFDLTTAQIKLRPYLNDYLSRLCQQLGIDLPPTPTQSALL